MNSCRKCGSFAINEHLHGRTPGINPDLCDVCYWREMATQLRTELDTLCQQRDELVEEIERIQALKDSDKSCGEISCDDCNARYAQMRSQRDELIDGLNQLYKTLPSYLDCDNFHHLEKDAHSYDEICQPSKRYTDAVGRLTKILTKSRRRRSEVEIRKNRLA